ncbi:MAG: hypothetical protein SA339_09605 [Methanomassiliicoccus sp.]|nr:hypothetical protein [Methanomassiliicoccus sp.]
MAETEESKVVSIQIRLIPMQAERLEKLYRIFSLTKSDVTDATLEVSSKVGQDEIRRKVVKRSLNRIHRKAGK